MTFRWSYGEMLAVKGSKSTSLYTGMPIWNAYFCDLSGDGLPELCSTISWGSGMIDNRVIIYDYANEASYELSDRGNFDFTLRFHEADGYLYVDKRKYNTDEPVQSGRLVFKDDCLQVEGFSSNIDEPAKYYLTIGAEGVKSIEFTMPNSSGGCETAAILIPKWEGCCSGFSFYGSNATIVSFGSFSFSQFRRYAIALFAKRFVFIVSQSASRTIFAVPFSKFNEISPHSPSQSA